MAPGHRRQPDRGQPAGRQGGLHPQLPYPRRRPDSRAAAGALRLRLQLLLRHPREPHGGLQLSRDDTPRAGHRRQPHLLRVDGRVRLRTGARGRPARTHRPGRLQGRIRRPEAPVRQALSEAGRAVAMVAIMRSAVVNAPIEAVWRLLRDFNSHHLWHPAVAASEIEDGLPPDQPGCVRRFRLRDGAELREQLIALSDRDFSLTYCILDSPIPLLDYVATERLRPVTDGGRTFWEWRSSFRTPPGQEEELAGMVARDIYEGGFKGLQRFLDRG